MKPNTAQQANAWLTKQGLDIMGFAEKIGADYGTAVKWFCESNPIKPRRMARKLIAAHFPKCPLIAATPSVRHGTKA